MHDKRLRAVILPLCTGGGAHPRRALSLMPRLGFTVLGAAWPRALDSPCRLRHRYPHYTELWGGPMRITRPLLTALFLTTLAALLPAIATAQTGAGSLTGIVSDQSGGKVPGATVTATNQATNVAYTAVSNEAGNYTMTSVPVGTYVVKAELSGFKTVTTAPMTVEAKAIVRMDFDLQLGAIEETILVAGQSPLLQTETATVGEVISGTTVNE